MKWMRTENTHKPPFPSDVVKFCSNCMLPMIPSNHLSVHTEHRRYGHDGSKFMFRASPCYHHDSGQDSSVWYDWAVFDVDESPIPCQILCFVRIDALKPNCPHFVRSYPVTENSNYAVVRRMESPPSAIRGSKYVKLGFLANDLYLFDCETIKSEIAVVHDDNSDNDVHNRFMVVSNRINWLKCFDEIIDSY